MGRKRKIVTFAGEGTTSNACSETINVGPKPSCNGSGAKRRAQKFSQVVPRRSSRLNSPIASNLAHVSKPVVEHLIADEDDKEEDERAKKDTASSEVTKLEEEDSNLDANDKRGDQGSEEDTIFAQIVKPIVEDLNLDEKDEDGDQDYEENPILAQVTKHASECLNADKSIEDKGEDSEEDRILAQVTKPASERLNVDENIKDKGEVSEEIPVLAQVAKPASEHLNVDENDNGEDQDPVEVKSPEKTPQKPEENANAVATKSRDSPSSDFSYKRLYIIAQKKIESLMEEKFALLSELQFERGKNAAYEKMKDVFAASKEVIVIPGLSEALRARANVSTD